MFSLPNSRVKADDVAFSIQILRRTLHDHETIQLVSDIYDRLEKIENSQVLLSIFFLVP